MNTVEIIILVVLLLLLLLQLALWRRPSQSGSAAAELMALQNFLQNAHQQQMHNEERSERSLREQIQNTAQATRQELAANFGRLQQGLATQLSTVATMQKAQIDGFSVQMAALTEGMAQQLEHMRQALIQQGLSAREEQAGSLKGFADTLTQTLNTLTESNAARMLEIRSTLEQKISQLQLENGAKLEEMRRTVDEKLHATLEQRLGESFKQVSDRLEKVHQGLGEMQQLAIGVGDLKRVLTNVKTRGTWGEVQLEMVLEQMLTSEQYGKNVETIPGSGERVEFAIKLPGKEEGKQPVWLPVDAKFPKEQYERLLDAAERADADGVAAYGKELERAIRSEAKTIAEKYLSPPLTTDFAILFLPTEGLYAEVMRRPGLADELQRTCRVSIAGPSTLSALLNSLQMGFRTLVLEKRSSEVWQVLGAVKTEFGKFGEILANTKTALERAARNIDQAEVRTRQMTRKLKQVEALPSEQARQILGVVDATAESDSTN
ncbi:DNA recombination protein RmuC [Undibacterium sp. CCC2.1]|uniref:DNA recombination protein RmuC n=2 Tax=unclassified Undibacterium TaxID=2630295 RepID=UPI002AC8E832|nr:MULTISPECIES: DNA recombination protein RmuC [unclassified Undibacterium]MEB0138707.1 DNA recombination protein RmuC [Undibacterium sp. CCC2.1]MEB0171508.1 DNA recombination protein RmuC [Undibacterium sp. CCC1.1]MEB0175421.1 DNA recombination protein RmuC [Undibacterium sp. CCC3.4]MEB0214708.1 DNA recombination protein RmuC [Undibacterium sp. 5I2]WPX43333.1 DNA recombination protein RmuC [Undibacterium sp. CCC3.4]